ncbi:non-ribosomal peptide synthetase, partial [Streptomyces sp. NPDC048279]
MGTRVESDREFWSRVLTSGSATAVPRWAPQPAQGTAEHEIPVPDGTAQAVRDLAGRRSLPVDAPMLAAHLKVLAVLSGETEVVTGYTTGADGDPLPCRVSVPSGSWADLVTAAHHAEAEIRAHRDFPVAELRRELGLTEPPFEVVSGPAADRNHAGLTPADDAVLHVRWSDRDER